MVGKFSGVVVIKFHCQTKGSPFAFAWGDQTWENRWDKHLARILASSSIVATQRDRDMATEIECCGTRFSLYVLVIVGLVCFAGLMAGLTLGLMSLGLVDLEVLIKSGRPQDRIHAGTPFSSSS